jgi:FkbM family methyltransferase
MVNLFFFDVGANKGEHTIYFLKKASKSKIDFNVFSFDPFPNAIEIIKKKLSDHKFTDKIKIIQKAKSDKEGKSSFFYDSKEQASGQNSLIDHYMLDSKIDVDTITLDSFCKSENIGKINFLKIDIEGYEINALKGAKMLLNNNKIDYLQLEYNQTWIEAGALIKKLLDITKNNYKLFILRKNNLLSINNYHYVLDDFFYCNLLLVNKNKPLPFKVKRKALPFI